MHVARVAEGLAPGALQPISGDYLDSHSMVMAADFTINGKSNDPDTRKLLLDQAMTSDGGGLVIYKNFVHRDFRSGPLAYLDMTDVKMPQSRDTCEKFEFSRVRQIAAGTLQGDVPTCLCAWVGDEIYIYLIKAFLGNGLIDKQLWIRKAPVGFGGFIEGRGLSWKTQSGSVQVLSRQ
jgi:hypothetical protein